MSVLFVMTLISVIGQCVIVRLLTDDLWLKTLKPTLAGVLQFLGTAVLMQIAGGVISGIGSVIILVLAGLDDPVLGFSPAAEGMLFQGLFGLLVVAPFLYLLFRIIKLVRAARATAAWQQGKT